jgi:uroporphyrinogen decarboxylase
MAHFADAVGNYLAAQIDAGANAVQIFDSWGGLLSAHDYRQWVLPHMQAVVRKAKRPGVPVIIYLKGTSHLVDVLSDTGCDVLSVDWRTNLTTAAETCQSQTALQGNLDPLALYSHKSDIRDRAREIIQTMDQTGKGHVFNLGHGILPTTAEESVRVLVETVHSIPPKSE